MDKANSTRGLLEQELAAVEWSQHDKRTVLRAIEQGGNQPMKAKKMKLALVLTLTLTLVLLSTTALAAVLRFSPRYDALQLAHQALLEKYSITEKALTALHHTITEKDGEMLIVYEMTEAAVMQENRFGQYTVTVADGKADATWSLDGMDTTNGLDAPAWGAEQLLMYVENYATVMSYMESHDMLTNIVFDAEAFLQKEAQQQQDKATTLEMAKITLDEADEVGRAAVTARYTLTEQQSAMLVRFTGEDDESTYALTDDRPLVNLFFHLTQNAGEWTEKDGIYVVTINLLDGTVEDIVYDSPLLGNG